MLQHISCRMRKPGGLPVVPALLLHTCSHRISTRCMQRLPWPRTALRDRKRLPPRSLLVDLVMLLRDELTLGADSSFAAAFPLFGVQVRCPNLSALT